MSVSIIVNNSAAIAHVPPPATHFAIYIEPNYASIVTETAKWSGNRVNIPLNEEQSPHKVHVVCHSIIYNG